ncbi:MAG: translation initiation factor IF-2 [Bacteroidia bacterium]
MSEDKGTRLSVVVKDLNIGIDHIVEFLGKKGFAIEKKPTAKISSEAYDLLQKEFAQDKQIKQVAQEITKEKQRKENIVIEARQTSAPFTENKPEKEDNLQASLFHIKQEAAEKEKLKKVSVKEKEPAQKTGEVEKEIPAKKEVPVEPEIIKAKADKIEQPKVLGKIDLEEKPNKDGKKTEKKSRKVEPKTAKGKKKKEEEIEKISETEGEVEKPVTEIKDEEQTGVPVVSAEQPEEIIEDTITPSEEDQKDVPYRTERERLSGPTILGKINLPVDPPKKKPVASSGAFESDRLSKKKKRRRTDKKVNITKQVATVKSTEVRPDWKKGKPDFSKKKRDANPEVTDKQIQDQIKATLARLSGGGKSRSSKMRKQKREAHLQEREVIAEEAAKSKVIKVTEFVSANELAKLIGVPVTNIISTCMSLGLFVSINQRLDAETLSVVSGEFGYTIEFVSVDVQEAIQDKPDDPSELEPRAPIVTVMGHVDHGKTSLLDYIRKTNVIAGEAGGITQHIGAYEVSLENGKKIAFLDTPGHEAFTAMRARGAKVTDVAIIVVSADDSVMPQTVEAINHAQAANVPIVFAINKVDKPGSSPDRIKEQLSKMNILVEEWGGKYQSQEISAKLGTNIDSLLDKVLLEAELLDLKANPHKNGVGTVIESSLDKGRGYLATVLVQTGELKVGDVVLAGCYSGRVKAMFNERGQRMDVAGPSTPSMILGLSGAPQAGDQFHVMDDEREAREIANKRMQLQREQGIRTHKHITLDEIGRRLAIGNFKELNVIVKGDVDGSIEALADSLLKLSTPEIQVNVIHKSVGAITESDVLLASASNAIIIGFQVRPSVNARKLAEHEQIDIRLYSIIYDAINEVKAAMEGMLAPDYEEKIVCNVEVRDVFKIPKVGTIAGCMVLDGKITRNTKIRLVRDGIVTFTGELASLKRFKDDVKEVATGYECGLNIANFNDVSVGDIIEGYEQVAVKRTLA